MIVIYDVVDLSVLSNDSLDISVKYWTKTRSGPVTVNVAQGTPAAMQTEFQTEFVAALASDGIATTTGELRRLSAL